MRHIIIQQLFWGREQKLIIPETCSFINLTCSAIERESKNSLRYKQERAVYRICSILQKERTCKESWPCEDTTRTLSNLFESIGLQHRCCHGAGLGLCKTNSKT